MYGIWISLAVIMSPFLSSALPMLSSPDSALCSASQSSLIAGVVMSVRMERELLGPITRIDSSGSFSTPVPSGVLPFAVVRAGVGRKSLSRARTFSSRTEE